jgi:hypothetical protein
MKEIKEMRAPSKSIGESLRQQRAQGRGPEMIEVSEQRRAGPLVAPGEGRVVQPPGPRDEQSAAVYADVVGKRFGGG